MTEKANKVKIVFIQPAYAKYRQPLFDKFLSYYNMTLYFMRQSEVHLQYEFGDKFPREHFLPRGGSHPNWLVHIVREYLGEPLALVSELMKNDYSAVVSSISDSPQTIVSLFVSRIRKAKCVLWVEEWSSPITKKPLSMLSTLLRTYVLKNVDAIVVEGTSQYIYVRKFSIPKEKVFFSNHCSLDYSNYLTKDLKKKLNIKGFLVVLYLGRIVKRKGLDILIQAFSKIEEKRSDVALVVCGNGEFLPYCEQLGKKLGARNIFFLGGVSEGEVASVYEAADVFVLPSCIRSGQGIEVEGWGLVINEAMSMGKPIITTDAVGAAKDLVKENINGYIVKNGDANELCRALDKILGNERLRNIMGKNSRKIFEDFNDFDKMFEGFRKAIEYAIQPMYAKADANGNPGEICG